ncbi:MAG: fatty acid hydroxylase [Bacteroidetes bacterium]|nr:fatty acid hydroxylase [Bacteroidota bacterium]
MEIKIQSQQGRIFKNNFLEKLTKSTPTITITYYICLIALFFYLSSVFTTLNFAHTIGLYLFGLMLWTLMEYILHRFIFHIDDYFPECKRLHYILHGVHHENPKDKERLFMPPVPGALIAFTLFVFWFIFFGWNALALMAGITNGYLLYSYIHYTVHTKPTKLFMQKLWIHHLKHHYKYPHKAYGVSSPFWDIVFRTMPPEHPNERKKTN